MSAMSSGQAGYYLGLAREDYYLEGGEPPGRWYGEGAASLGLAGEVRPDELYNLFAGRAPRGHVSLIQRQGHEGKAEHRPGWDLTFSAPKSVSVLWSQSGPEHRARMQEAHAQAVRAALGYLQDASTSTRRGKGGGRLERVGMIASTFEHSTSRALDPQLHTHCLVMNLSVRDDGTTGTLSSLDLFLSKMAAGALYRVELAKRLQERCGLALRRERSWFEAAGVSPELIQAFSKRRQAIEERLRETGLTSAEAASVAAIQTRSAKRGASRAELFEEWRSIGEEHGWSPKEAEGLFGSFVSPIDPEASLRRVCETATGRISEDQAHFSEREFLRHLAEEAQCLGVGASEVRLAAQNYLAESPEIVRLGEHRGEERFSTRKMMALERDLLESAERLAKRPTSSVEPETFMGALAKGTDLGEEQLKAAWHLTVATGGLAVVSGMAGTGKTRMLDTARRIWEEAGYEVKGAALAARAADELADGAGIEAGTIARTLMDIDRGRIGLKRNAVLVVDEAGMVATPDMRRLTLACERAGAKLVLIGDERQLQPIGPGAPFRELGKRHGQAELRDIRRQDEHWAREAVKDMAGGDSRRALEAFAERGLLTVSQTRDGSMEALIERWHGSGAAPEDTLILAGTRNEVKRLNALAQEKRLEGGELWGASTPVGEDRVYLNDRVMFTKNRPKLGLNNGDKGTVDSVSRERMTVRLDSGERVSFEPHSVTEIMLGYASTTHKAQGATTSRAFVLGGGPMQGRELAYVQASRARVETAIFATASEAGDDVAQLAREMARSHEKQMAHPLLKQPEVDRPPL